KRIREIGPDIPERCYVYFGVAATLLQYLDFTPGEWRQFTARKPYAANMLALFVSCPEAWGYCTPRPQRSAAAGVVFFPGRSRDLAVAYSAFAPEKLITLAQRSISPAR